MSPVPNCIWIFITFKLGTNDTIRLPTTPGKSEIDKTVLPKLFSFFVSICNFFQKFSHFPELKKKVEKFLIQVVDMVLYRLC